MELKPIYYVKNDAVFQRPIRNRHTNGIRMGFRVCTVASGVDPNEVCAILNKGEPATSDDLEA